MNDFFLNTIAKALHTYLLLDPESKQRLSALQGTVATVEFPPLPIICQLVFTGDGIEIKENNFLPEQVKIRGTPLRLLSMMLADDKKPFFADDIQIEGSSELGQKIVELFDRLEIDWEEYLSRTIGDIPAHQVGRFARQLKNWFGHAQSSVWQNTSDYLHEEAALFPTREALQDFYADVDQLRMDLDRLAAKIQLLTNPGTDL